MKSFLLFTSNFRSPAPNLAKLKGQCTNRSVVRAALKCRKHRLAAPDPNLSALVAWWHPVHPVYLPSIFRWLADLLCSPGSHIQPHPNGVRTQLQQNNARTKGIPHTHSIHTAHTEIGSYLTTTWTKCQPSALSIFCSSSLRQKIIPPRGPRRVLWVVVVTTSA